MNKPEYLTNGPERSVDAHQSPRYLGTRGASSMAEGLKVGKMIQLEEDDDNERPRQ
jgi:hypothetical protein